MGDLAGEVWDYLQEEDESSLSGVSRAIDAPQSKVNMALGWLAREGKLDFVDNGRGTSVRLR
ncbi:MAG: winged helix-turn-helix domain-containing protein [Candidatus Nanohaloarchaea archaeon]